MISNGHKIRAIDANFLKGYSSLLRTEYAKVLDVLRSEVKEGNLIKLDKYVRSNVNGTFCNIIKNFVIDYENCH